MARLRHLLSGCALAACAVPAFGQSPYGQPYTQPGYVNPFGPQSDADQLAQQMRLVAANPTYLYALLNAARLSLKVGDTDAAAALYTRAERVNPMNPQVKAGVARLLVQSGRPGAALRKFQEAERSGATLTDFGPDRALAYDLVGEQPRAQREYRALLRQGTDDETVRRYALSLGISGLKDPALALLEPLNRRSDRGAWRARAFVLAMNDDRRGAERIATTMMPPGMAQGLAPFFDRLPRLSATERAFAVSFGETRASPTRLADARLVPSLPALSPEPNPFPQSRAPVQQAAFDDVDDGKKKKRRKKDKPPPARAARQPYVAPLPPPPAPTATQLAALTASRYTPGTFMPARTGGRVTVLPPPADAYRGPVTQVAAQPIDAAEGDEPDFAVAAVSALAKGRQPGGQAPAAPARSTGIARLPSAGASTSASTLMAGPVAAPRSLALSLASGAPVTSAASAPPVTSAASPLFGDRPATGTNFSLAGTSPPSLPSRTPPSLPAPSVATPSVTPSPVAAVTPSAPVATTVGAASPPTALASVAIAGTSVVSPPIASSALSNSTLTGTGATPAPGFTGLTSVTPPAAVTVDGAVSTTIVPASNVLAATPAPAEGNVAGAAPTPEAAVAPTALASAAITPSTGAPPPPQGMGGDDALAAILARIKVPEIETAAAKPSVASTEPPAATGTKLLANIDAKVAAAPVVAKTVVKTEPAKADPALPKKDARGRFVDASGKPLLDDRGRPMGPKGAAAWQRAQAEKPDVTLPKKDARGRFVDAKGKPLLDDRGRPMGRKGAAAWQLAQAGKAEAADKPDATLPKKDARGRFVDAKGKPLLDDRGRPMGPKGAAAWQLAENQADDAAPAKGKPDAALPKKDARGRFVDAAGKPLLDARGRPMDAKAAAAWKLADAKKKPDPAKGEPQRYWVQVAGGANEASLGREWSRVSAASPSLKGKQGWTAPLRATNRILTGPFKSSAEAMAAVNQLKKEGVSAFMFTSDAGQKVTRLGK